MRTVCRCLIVAALFLAGTGPVRAQEKLTDLLKYLPDNTNVVVAMDVHGLYQSKLAKREDWAKKVLEQHISGAILPPSVQHAVFAAKMHFGVSQPEWEIGVVRTKDTTTLREIARLTQGTSVGMGRDEVVVLSNSYVGELAPRIFGSMSPANRQTMSKWMKSARTAKETLIEGYLRDAAAKANEQQQIVIALDLSEVTDPTLVKLFLAQAKSLKGKNVDLNALARLIDGIKGVTMTVKIDSDISAEIRIDFSDSPRPFEDIMKPLLVEALAGSGTTVQDVDKWQGRSSLNAYLLDAKLSAKDLRRILAFIQPSVQQVTQEPMTGPDAKLKATKKYWSEVQALIEDLYDRKPSDNQSNNAATWYSKFAQKIDQLPLNNVDNDMVSYGQSMSALLRALADSLRGVVIDLNVLENQKVSSTYVYSGSYGYGYGGGYGGYGGYGYASGGGAYNQNNFDQMRAAQSQTIANSEKDRMGIRQKMNDETQRIKRTMVDRYKIDF